MEKENLESSEKPEKLPELPKIPPEVEKKLKQIKAKVDKFKKEIIKKFDKYIIGISLLPPKKEEKDKINILVLIDDSDVQKMSYEELTSKIFKIIETTASEIDKNLSPEIMLLGELRESCFDAKYEILQLIASSAIVYDPKDTLSAIKIAEVHKTMVIKKFEKYITSYVAVGSLFRGDATSNDIDVAVVVDDTDVKKMSRMELKDKLMAIIIGMGYEASAITGVKKSFHIQVYILTDFWDAIKDASPVIFTFLRDGVPLYDRGTFTPWRLLLKMGRIKPSREAIDMHMEIGEKLIERVKGKLMSIVAEDLYYAVLNPSQAALMLYGIAPPTPKETIQLLDEIFVKKEKIFEPKYIAILQKIRDCYKNIEHGKIKEISGKEIDDLLKDTSEYLKRIKKLFGQIEKRSEGKNVLAVYDACIAVVNDLLKIENIEVKDILKDFEKYAEKNKMPKSITSIFKEVISLKEDYKKLKKQEIEKIKKNAGIFIKTLIDYIQRRRGLEIERARIRIKYGDKFGEVLLLDKIAFIIIDIDAKEKEIQKADVTNEGGLANISKSSIEELEKYLAEAKIPYRVFIKEKIFENLKDVFGKDIEVLISE